MDNDSLTLNEAAAIMRKSTQTLRRMIKNGELKAKKFKSPQGFLYRIPLSEIDADEMLYNSPIQTPIQHEVLPHTEALNQVPPIQDNFLYSRHEVLPVDKPNIDTLDKKPVEPEKEPEIFKFLERSHIEKMSLFKIIELLQSELEKERRKPRSFLGHFMDWMAK